MTWDESKHPRDGDGRFTDGNGTDTTRAKLKAVLDAGYELPLNRDGGLNEMRLDRLYAELEKDSYSLPDEQLPRSVGAKWENHKILLPDGSMARFVEGTKLQDKKVFAGKGCKRKIDCVDRLVKNYGGDPAEWMKVKANAEIELPNGETAEAEVHWYEETTIGKHQFKVKRYFDES